MKILLGNELINADNIAGFSVEGRAVVGCDECGKLIFTAMFEDKETAEKALRTIKAQIEPANEPVDILTAVA